MKKMNETEEKLMSMKFEKKSTRTLHRFVQYPYKSVSESKCAEKNLELCQPENAI